MNLTFRYTDTTALTHSGAVAPVLLGQFTFLSTVGAFNLNGVYTSQDLPVNPANSTPQTSNGFLTVPAPDGGWTLAMLGSALVGFGLLRRRFRLN
jgi:hypothetical protein